MAINRVNVVPTLQSHVDQMQGHLRKADRDECWALAHVSAKEGLKCSFNDSALCWTGLYKGKPCICFGVAPMVRLSKKGQPWLLGTEEIRYFKYEMAKRSKMYVAKMFERFDVLENWVDSRNKISIEWLKWCGFNIEPAIYYGVEGKKFHRFWKVKEA